MMLSKQQVRKLRLGKCITPFCRNRHSHHRRYCYKCRTRRYKERHPVTYWFNVLRKNARRRGKDFDLTLEEFTEFVQKTGYLENKGRGKLNLTVDRKDSRKGYSMDNIRAITLSDNSRKGYHDKVQQRQYPF